MSDALMTVNDLANYLSKPKSWVYDNHKPLGIPSCRIGQAIRFRRAAVDAWLDEQTG